MDEQQYVGFRWVSIEFQIAHKGPTHIQTLRNIDDETLEVYLGSTSQSILLDVGSSFWFSIH